MLNTRSSVTRRRFLATAAKAGAVLAAPMVVPGAVLGKDGGIAPSERITLAGIGINNRGSEDLRCFMEQPVVQVVGIADVRKDRREFVKKWAESKYGPGVAMYRDFREMLPRQDIDAVLIATGDRWHTMASIYAAKAGKNIYCEKPCSMTIAESEALADIAERYGVVYQAGTQRRSIANFIFARDLCRNGKLGKLTAVHANTLHPATNHDWLPAQPEPSKDDIDWDLWVGPCPWRPYNRSYIDGGWHGCFDFHGGGILEWGAHTVDLCNWAGTNDEKTPALYEPAGMGASTPATWNGGKRRRLRRHFRRRAETGHAILGLVGPRHLLRSLRGHRGLGRDRRQRPNGILVRQPACRTTTGQGSRNLARQPREELPRLHQDSETDQLEREGRCPQPYHLPCGLHRLATWTPAEVRSGQGRIPRRRRSQPDAVAIASRAVAGLENHR